MKYRTRLIGHSVANGSLSHCNISSKAAVLPGHNDAEMGFANSLHALAQYIECNERINFDLKKCRKPVKSYIAHKICIFACIFYLNNIGPISYLPDIKNL